VNLRRMRLKAAICLSPILIRILVEEFGLMYYVRWRERSDRHRKGTTKLIFRKN
jgi:hypothetical protein